MDIEIPSGAHATTIGRHGAIMKDEKNGDSSL
jgi:hypothetical protein